jgi:molybdate transport system regulatory protein
VRVGPLKLKAQLYRGGELAMGPGKADLLDAIHKHGSISAAGRDLGMSYRRAWLLVDTMNRCWREPLVATRSGGGADRGATVTDLGRAVLTAYRGLESRLASAASDETMAFLTRNLLVAPSADG